MSTTIWNWSLKNGVSAALDQINGSLTKTFAKVATAEREVQQASDNAAKSVGFLSGALDSMKALAVTAFSLYAISGFGREVYRVGTTLETLNNVINYTSGSSSEAARNNAFLKQTIHDLRLPVLETTDGFSQMNAALMGSALQGEPARKIFHGVSTAVTAMHLSSAQANQVFMALNQMVSKGTVQAQELKLQLGNALPGAFQLAAKSMGVTTAQFGKMMDAGQVMANDFLPKFAAALEDKFKGAIPNAIQSTTARMTELSNLRIELFDQLFIKLQPFINQMIGFAIEVLPPVMNAIGALVDILSSLAGWFSSHITLMKVVAIGVGALTVSWLTMKTVMLLTTGVMSGLTIAEKAQFTWMLLMEAATKSATLAQLALNFALINNPIGWIVTALAAAIGLIVVFWNKLDGLVAVLKRVGQGIIDGLLWPIRAVGDAIDWVTGKSAPVQGSALAIGAAASIPKPGSFSVLDTWMNQVRPMSEKSAKASSGMPYTGSSATGAGSSSGSEMKVRNVNVRIDRLAEITINAAGNLNMTREQIKRFVEEVLTAAVRDSEMALQ